MCITSINPPAREPRTPWKVENCKSENQSALVGPKPFYVTDSVNIRGSKYSSVVAGLVFGLLAAICNFAALAHKWRMSNILSMYVLCSLWKNDNTRLAPIYHTTRTLSEFQVKIVKNWCYKKNRIKPVKSWMDNLKKEKFCE